MCKEAPRYGYGYQCVGPPIHRPIGKESAVGKHTERLASTPLNRGGLTRDEEVVKSMVDHPAGRRCHGDEEELDLPFLNDEDEPWRVPLEWIFDGFCLLVALILLFVSITTFGVL
nr:MAG TPA: hypothetical protein [Caudoviricetes sp.]